MNTLELNMLISETADIALRFSWMYNSPSCLESFVQDFCVCFVLKAWNPAGHHLALHVQWPSQDYYVK